MPKITGLKENYIKKGRVPSPPTNNLKMEAVYAKMQAKSQMKADENMFNQNKNPKISSLLLRLNSRQLDKSFEEAQNNKKVHKPIINNSRKRRNDPDEDGFSFPKNPAKIKNTKQDDPAILSQANSFESLDNLMDQDEPTVNATEQGTKQKTIIKNVTNKSKPRKNIKPPPIEIFNNGDIKKITTLLIEKEIKKTEVIIKKIDNSLTISTNNLENYNKCLATLTENKIGYYTYTPRDLRPKNLVMKGVTGDYTVEEIQEELTELTDNKIKIKKVIKFIFNKKRTDRYFHIVQVDADEPIEPIIQIRAVALQRVRWEKLRKVRFFQCRNCQRIGHASANCTLPRRCVKCAGDHPVNECKISKDASRSELKCANCKENGHPASYKGCPYFVHTTTLTKELDKQKKGKMQSAIKSANKYATTGRSYRDAITNNNNNLGPQPEPTQNYYGPQQQPPHNYPGPQYQPTHNFTGPPPIDQIHNDHPPPWMDYIMRNVENMINKKLEVFMNKITEKIDSLDKMMMSNLVEYD